MLTVSFVVALQLLSLTVFLHRLRPACSSHRCDGQRLVRQAQSSAQHQTCTLRNVTPLLQLMPASPIVDTYGTSVKNYHHGGNAAPCTPRDMYSQRHLVLM